MTPTSQDISFAWSTVRSFLRLLTDDDTLEPDWHALLRAAIASVPGAEAGSLIVREERDYVTRAQVGFHDALIGAVHPVSVLRRWYDGDVEAWHAGRPRVRRGEALRTLTHLAQNQGGVQQTSEILDAHGERDQLCANLLLPIRVNNEVVAELNLDSLSDEHAFGDDAVAVAEEFGLLLALVLATKRRRAHEVAVREGALLTLGLALEARDLETHGHTERVVTLAVALGRALHLSAAELDALRQGAYLHDLGKLQVPDQILLKPGKLTPDEWNVMKSHSACGFELAGRVPGLSPLALGLILHHHERWDGAGYPHGLAGEAIPLLARIFSVCDVYDALTSERPYKAAWTHEDAVRELTAQRGRQFDPCVVDVFVREVLAQHASPPLAAPS